MENVAIELFQRPALFAQKFGIALPVGIGAFQRRKEFFIVLVRTVVMIFVNQLVRDCVHGGDVGRDDAAGVGEGQTPGAGVCGAPGIVGHGQQIGNVEDRRHLGIRDQAEIRTQILAGGGQRLQLRAVFRGDRLPADQEGDVLVRQLLRGPDDEFNIFIR